MEKSGGVVPTEMHFVWCDAEICEERNASNEVVNRYLNQGEQQGGTDLFYTRDHLGSVRELTDASVAIRAEYAFDPFGLTAKVLGTSNPALGLPVTSVTCLPGSTSLFIGRTDTAKARWISRDPIGEAGGENLYAYARNDPVNEVDDLGGWPNMPNILGPGGAADSVLIRLGKFLERFRIESAPEGADYKIAAASARDKVAKICQESRRGL